MLNCIRKVYPQVLNKVFSLKFHVDSQVWQETPEEGQRTHQPKHCEYNYKNEDISPNTLSGMNKSTQILF